MGWIPAIAAAAKKRREQAEEEKLIKELQEGDSQGIYEYKVLRSYRFAFAGETRLRAVLDEEAHAGWEMVAKLDSGRLMLRRRRSDRSLDAALPPGVDAYRTVVDSNIALMVGLAIGVVLLVLLLLGLMRTTAMVLPVVIVLLGIVVLAFAVAVRSQH